MEEKVQLRKRMIFHKQFLLELYNSNALKSKKVLTSATDAQLKLLINILHFVSIGDIPLSRQSFNSISKSRKTTFLSKKFDSKAKTKKLVKSSRKEQLGILFKLGSSYGKILESLFVPQ